MHGADFLGLDPTGVGRGARTDWLTARIRGAVADGTLITGSRLPSTRTLAADLGFSRGTVAEAYRRLTEEGLITGTPGSGTVIASAPPALRVTTAPARGLDVRSEPEGASAPERAAAAESATVIDLGTGLPDLTAFPRAAWLRAEKDVLATATPSQLGYAPAEGTAELRGELSHWLARSRGVRADPERIIVTAGVTGALSLLAQTLRNDGHDTVAVEDPGAEGNRRILDYWLPRTTSIAVDSDGMDVRSVGASDARAALVTPAHQYPTGVVLSPLRRRELVAWAADRDHLIIEDDYDAEYRYDRRPVRALQPLAPDAVAYTASLSKTLAPALRLGWLVPPAHLHDRLVTLRWATDLGSPALPQLALAHLLRSGALERHLRTMRTRHRERRDSAVAAIATQLPDVRVSGIAAGLHLVILLPDRLDDEQIATDAREAGVIVQPLSRYRTAPGAPGLIINYAAHQPARLNAAISILARVLGRRTA